MNLRESFRYQNFLDTMMRQASSSIQQRDHCLNVTKTHLRNKANPDAQDATETVESEVFFANDDVIDFMEWLVNEREKLTTAIGAAKASVGFDIDAAIETNKFRQTVNNSIRNMLRYIPTKRVEQGRDYKFNNEGNQAPYVYDIEVVSEEAYDKDSAKALMREMIFKADAVSTAIDTAMINTLVGYEPVFNVNETFEDVMTDFIASRKNDG